MMDRPWLRNYGSIPREINPDAWPSVLHLLERAMKEHADRTAFRCFDTELSYAKVDILSAFIASFLQHELGAKRGDRIAVMMPNLAAFPVTLAGIVRAGAAQVNVNPLYTPRELEHQLNDAGCEIIFVYGGATSTLAEVLPRTGIRHVIVVDAGSCLSSPVPTPDIDPNLSGAIRFSDALKAGSRRARQPIELGGEDLLFLQYTGGTTGLSKGAALTHRNLVAMMCQAKAFLPGQLRVREEVIVTAIPLYHVFGLAVNLLMYFEAGAENWLVPNPRDMESFVATLKAARPTAFTGVNTLFNALLTYAGIEDVDWSRMRLTIGGGAAVMRATSDRWQALTGQSIREGYGLSETSAAVSLVPAGVNHFTGTCGLPMPSTDVRLIDDDGNDVAAGTSGEIAVRGPQVMRRYWNQPAATTTAFTSGGYFRTGDVGQFDEQGFLKIVDRKKDMVLVSGFNVYPNEVEAVVTACPGVLECACVGIPDDVTGEAVKIFVVRMPGEQMAEADVIAHCRGGLAAYKVPKVVQFVDVLPKSTVGKVLRRELRSLA